MKSKDLVKARVAHGKKQLCAEWQDSSTVTRNKTALVRIHGPAGGNGEDAVGINSGHLGQVRLPVANVILMVFAIIASLNDA